MGVFHVFYIVQMVPNRAKRHIYTSGTLNEKLIFAVVLPVVYAELSRTPTMEFFCKIS